VEAEGDNKFENEVIWKLENEFSNKPQNRFSNFQIFKFFKLD